MQLSIEEFALADYHSLMSRYGDSMVPKYGEPLRVAFRSWIHELLKETEVGSEHSSEDAVAFLEQFMHPSYPVVVGYERWQQQTIINKITSIVNLIRHRQPLWQFRIAHIDIDLHDARERLIGYPSYPLYVIYEIDRNKDQFLVKHIIGPPRTSSQSA